MRLINAYLEKLAQVESGNNPLAKNPKSTAKGRFQFINDTAKQYGITAPLGTPEYQRQETEAVQKFTQDNKAALKENLGREPTAGELYLAHQQGADGAVKLLQNPDALAVDVLGKEKVLNNGGNEKMTATEFAQKWTQKFADIDAQQMQSKTINLYDLIDEKTGQLKSKVESTGTQTKAPVNLYDIMKPAQDDEYLIKPGISGIDKTKIDTRSGAPPYIRAIVGSSYKPEDKLATLQKYYPDAQPYDDGNFIYTNPETGNPTLYNPKGIDTGDIASIAREGTITIGSGIGATLAGGAALVAGQLGPQVATPEEIVTVPLAAAAGSGLGSGIAANGFDFLMNSFGLKVDTTTAKERLVQTGTEVLAASGGELGGRLLAPAAKGLIGGGKATMQRTIDLFDKMGVTPTLATVADQGTLAPRMQSGLAQNVFSAKQIQKTVEKQLAQINKAAQDIVSSFGQAKTKQGAGEVIRKASIAAGERFTLKSSSLYDSAYDSVGRDTLLRVDSLKELRSEMVSELGGAKESLKGRLGPAIKRIDNIIADAGQDGISFESLRRIRTDIGEELKPLFGTQTDIKNSQLERIYGAITDDLNYAAMSVSDEAANKIKKADEFFKEYKQTSEKLLSKIDKFDADENAFKFVLNSSKDGGTALNILRKNFTPEEWDVVSASVLEKLGDPIDSGEFNIATFVTNYNKLPPEAIDALFSGARYKEARASLDAFVQVTEKLKDAAKYANTSNTAGATYTINLLDSLGAGAGGGAGLLLQGGGGGASVGLAIGYGLTQAGRIVAPKTAAKLITSEKFVRWLAEPVSKGTIDVTKHMGKLSAIAAADNELAPYINEYAETLKVNTE